MHSHSAVCQIFKFTTTEFVISEPSGALHVMVKVVAAVIGTVAAPPESEDWLKLPSGEDSTQLVTPCVFQKMDVRPPSGTEAGTAQMSALGGTTGAAGAGAVVVATTGLGVGVVGRTTGFCVRTGGV